jgi:hypothetical protein
MILLCLVVKQNIFRSSLKVNYAFCLQCRFMLKNNILSIVVQRFSLQVIPIKSHMKKENYKNNVDMLLENLD